MPKQPTHSFRSVDICYVGTMMLKSQRDKLAGILRFARDADMSVHQLDLSALSPKLCEQLLRQMNFAGIIVGEDCVWLKMRPFLERRRLPVVAMDPNHGDFDDRVRPAAIVELDSAAVAERIADFFLRRGYGHFAYVGYADGPWSPIERVGWRSALRRDAFVKRVRQMGHDCETAVVTGRFDKAERKRIGEWLRDLPKPCALMAYWDTLARDLADVCREFRIRIPEQLAIMGTDNHVTLCETTSPTLSSLEIDFEEGGFTAAKLLYGILHGKTARHGVRHAAYGAVSVIERASTQNFKSSARLVSDACDFIRRNATTGIGVRDVAAKVGVSPRVLQLRFAETVGHTVISEIADVKLDAVKNLLENTSLPVSEIAENCGYAYGHLANVFKRKTGVSPGVWRKRIVYGRAASCTSSV